MHVFDIADIPYYNCRCYEFAAWGSSALKEMTMPKSKDCYNIICIYSEETTIK
jgi:hypothetical protein